jgi:AraC-like DNA-binding protein
MSGPFRFWMSGSSGYQFIRTAQNISRAPADHCTVLLQVRGQTAFSRNDDSFIVQPHDIAIFDSRQPYSAHNSAEGRRVVAIIPRAMINLRAPWLRRRPLHRIASNSRFLDLARRHMVRLVSGKLNDNQTSLLTENLCNLLALASTDVAPNRLQAELQLEALLAYCRDHFHNPGLSAHFVAKHFGISVRTLHLRFEKLGRTFGRWLLETRLDACSKALKDPRQQIRSISDIAYSCGFNDLSHFNKTFRARFGMTPGEWRHKFKMQ